jgi:hypothetical protein
MTFALQLGQARPKRTLPGLGGLTRDLTGPALPCQDPITVTVTSPGLDWKMNPVTARLRFGH